MKIAMKIVLFTTLTAFILGSSCMAQILILSDNMENLDFNYDISSLNAADSGVNPDDLSDVNYTSSATGGNSDGSLTVNHEHIVDPTVDPYDGFSTLQSTLIENTFTYNPSVDGTILDISFSIDIATSDPFEDVFFLIEDSNTGGGFVVDSAFIMITTDGTFNNYSITGVTQSDIPTGFDFSGSNPLSFGFGFTSSTFVPQFVEDEFAVSADNFEVTINNVPEPSTGVLVILVAGFAILRRRNR